MTIEQLRSVHGAKPFRPYTLKLADGSRVRVRGPQFLVSPSRRTVVVVTGNGDGDFQIIDLVDAIQVGNRRPKPGNGRSRPLR
jgi:hypothetical protein